MDVKTEPAPSITAKRIADLDGPRRWPVLGNLLQLDIPRFHAQLEGWAKIYGPLYRLRIGPRDALVVSQPDLIASILRDRPNGWSRFEPMRAVIHEMGVNGLFTAEGESWRRQRRLVAAAFTPSHLKRYFPLIKLMTERLKGRLDSAAHAGSWIDLQSMLMRYTVDVTASLAFGIDVNTIQQTHSTFQQNLDKLLPVLMRRMNAPFPVWRYVKLPADYAFDRHLAAGHAAVKEFVQTVRERIAANPALAEQPTNLLEVMLTARDAEGAMLSEAEVAGNVFTILLAGEDTTANTLAWTLYLLHTHPEAWRAVVAEVDASLGANLVPDSIQASGEMTVIEDCSNESMRLRPVAPLTYVENNAPTRIGGVALPAGTLVLCTMRSGAVDASIAADAAEFRPSRWRIGAGAADDAAAAAGNRQLTTASMPFGAGPRVCPGRYLALLEMKMVLATIARNYELIEVGTENGAPPCERLDFTMSPVGLRMKLRTRAD
jgi:cytochrome P450